MLTYEINRLSDHPAEKEGMAQWFHEKWGIPLDAYLESMDSCLHGPGPVPEWYVAREGQRIIGGLGVIENDFHPRHDLTPNVCAVYVEPDRRRQGVAGALLKFTYADMARRGINTLYLITDHDSFYERHGWRYLCPVRGDGEETDSRMYVHTADAESN